MSWALYSAVLPRKVTILLRSTGPEKLNAAYTDCRASDSRSFHRWRRHSAAHRKAPDLPRAAPSSLARPCRQRERVSECDP